MSCTHRTAPNPKNYLTPNVNNSYVKELFKRDWKSVSKE